MSAGECVCKECNRWVYECGGGGVLCLSITIPSIPMHPTHISYCPFISSTAASTLPTPRLQRPRPPRT